MKVVFRVDASSTIGSGHLSRCLTLARALERCGFSADFATLDPGEHTRGWIRSSGYRVVELAGSDIGAVALAAQDASLVVVDGYSFGPELHGALRGPGRVVCVIDDVGAPVGGDVVLNGNFFAEDLAYEGIARQLLGPAYALVRDEFLAARGAQHASVPGRRRLLVTMGGADPAYATELFLRAMDGIDEADVRIVVGGTNPRAAAIRSLASRVARHRVEVFVDVARMSELMTWCDVAVAAAGSTCLELACIGVPAVVVSVADNQDPIADEVSRRGLMTSVGRIEGLTPEALATAVANLLGDPLAREVMAEKQRRTIDGQGAARAAKELARVVAGVAP